MRIFYQLGLNSYWFLIKIFTLFKPKARLFINGRKNWKEELRSNVNPHYKYIWIHCASLGEFEQGRPIIEKIKANYPQQKICLTFFSPSGYEVRKDYNLADIILYLPKDTKHNAKFFINTLKPTCAIFIKYEFWYNFLIQLHNQKIPTFLASAIFRRNQVFFKWYGKFFRKMLKTYHTIFVQNSTSKQLLDTVQTNDVFIAGDTRFDRVWEITQQSFNDQRIDQFKDSNLIMVAGSTWIHDEEKLSYLLSKNPTLKLILAPHEIEQSHINQILDVFKDFNPCLYKDSSPINSHSRVLIINTIGMLSSIYRYGSIAYIGGGFGKGIHNTLEAACYGVPVIFGPNYQKFNEAIELIKHKAGFSINSETDLLETISSLIENKNYIKSGENALNYVSEKLGATTKILEHLRKSDVL